MVDAYGELSTPPGGTMTARVGVGVEKRIAGPLSTFSQAWVDRRLDAADKAWGYGGLAGLRIRF